MSVGQPLRPTRALEDALVEFRDSLSDEQKAQLHALTATTSSPPGPDAVLLFTAQVDSHNALRKSRCVASRISGFLESLQQFTAIVDTFVSSNPAIAALVWGGVKVFILTACNFTNFFDELTTCFMSVQRLCPRYRQYEFLYKDSLPLQQSLCTFYTSLIQFCTRAMSFLKRQGFFQLAKSFVTPFGSEFGALRKELETNNIDVEHWIRFAADQAADQERRQIQKWRTSFQVFTNKDHDWKISQEQRKTRARHARMLNQLSDFDYLSALKRLRKKRFQNPNGLWLTKSTQYQDWLQQSSSSVFVLSGKMGSGKSVLSAAVVDNILLQQVPSGILTTFFFCEHDNVHSLTARTILGSLLRQSLPTVDLPRVIESGLQVLLNSNSTEGEEIGAFFCAVSDIARTHYLVVDGLDECLESEREVVFDILGALLKLRNPCFKIFISGRDSITPEVYQQLKPGYHLTMSCKEAFDDIEAVIDASLTEKLRKRKLVLQDGNLEARIKDVLVSGAHGMLLWVDLMIEDICAQTCDDDIRKTIEDLPTTLPEVFDRALARIFSSGKSEVAQKMFRWVAAAQRPLSLEEMREAIAIQPCQSSMRTGKLVTRIDQMISWSGNLLVLDEEESLVQFAHHSVKEYLERLPSSQDFRDFHFDRRDANRTAGEICVTYLGFTDFERQITTFSRLRMPVTPISIVGIVIPWAYSPTVMQSWAKFESMIVSRPWSNFDMIGHLQLAAMDADEEPRHVSGQLQEGYSLLAYASEYWLDHTRHFNQADCRSWKLWLNLLATDKQHVSKPWTAEQWDGADISILRFIIEHNHLALFSCMLEATGVLSSSDLEYLVTAWSRSYMRRIDWEAALTGASAHELTDEYHVRNLSTLRSPWENGGQLVQHRVLPLRPGFNDDAASDFVKVQSNLAKPDFAGCRTQHDYISSCFYVALLAATEDNDLNKARKYLDYSGGRFGQPPDSFSMQLYSPLEAAASKGYLDLAQLLLSRMLHGQTIECDDLNHPIHRALVLASVHGHQAIVSLIIESAHLAGTALTEPIVGASFRGHKLIVAALLQTGANVNAVSRRTKVSALIAASAGGHTQVLSLLLSAQADANIADSAGNTALHYVRRVPQMIHLLVCAGANLEARNKQGCTPLCHVAREVHVRVIENLIRAGANANATDDQGQSALHRICTYPPSAEAAKSTVPAISLLLSAGANLEAKDGTGRTPLSHYITEFACAKLKLSLSPEPYSISEEDLQFLERLFKASADVETLDEGDAPTVLSHAEPMRAPSYNLDLLIDVLVEAFIASAGRLRYSPDSSFNDPSWSAGELIVVAKIAEKIYNDYVNEQDHKELHETLSRSSRFTKERDEPSVIICREAIRFFDNQRKPT